MIRVTQENLQKLVEAGDKAVIYQAYNAFDTTTTREVQDAQEPFLRGNTQAAADAFLTYRFEFQCQAAAMAMTQRGVLIDPDRRAEAIRFHEGEENAAQRKAAELAGDAWDATELRTGLCQPGPEYKLTKPELKAGHESGGTFRTHAWPRGVDLAVTPDVVCRRCGLSRLRPAPLNVGSWQQVAKLLYRKWEIRPRYNRDGGMTTDDEALQSIEAEYRKKAEEAKKPETQARHTQKAETVHEILRARKARKQIGYARSPTSRDGRMRSSFNVGAAETGRWSASGAPDWTGWNIQQISDQIREIVVADPGLEIGYADLEKAESTIVAWASGDDAYIRAHQEGDTHTYITKLIFPDLPWVGELGTDQDIAEQPSDINPNHTWRHLNKGVQHGCNMGRTPQGIARQLRIPLEHAKKVVEALYGPEGVFPQVRPWQRAVRTQVQETGEVRTILGRRRKILGRTWEDETWREALGHYNQGPVADLLNLGLLRVWSELDTRPNIWDAPHPTQPNKVWLLAQVHDAILFLYRPGDESVLARVKDLMTIPIRFPQGLCVIPVEIQVGPSWKKSEMRKVKL